MPVFDIDLRNGASAGAFHHFHAPRRLQVDANLGDFSDALAFQEPFCRHAIRAYRRAIHADARHHFSTGILACCQAPMPPARTTTSPNPAFLSRAVAACDRPPVWQTTTAGRFLNFSNSAIRLSSWARGMFFAFGAWPVLNSAVSRTSIITASLRLSNCTACSAPTSGTPLRRRLIRGHTRMAPLTTAASTSHMLFNTNFIFQPSCLVAASVHPVAVRGAATLSSRPQRIFPTPAQLSGLPRDRSANSQRPDPTASASLPRLLTSPAKAPGDRRNHWSAEIASRAD